MNITAFRYLSAPSKFLPALIALGVNAILFWDAVRATSRRGAKTKNAVRALLRPRRLWVKRFEETIDQS